MAGITGARGTGNVLAANRKLDMASRVALLEPESNPLTLLLNRLSKAKTVNPEYKHLEDESEPRFDLVNNATGYAAGATSIVVDNGAYFAQHYIVQVTRTGENMRVTGVSGNTLTVVRGVGSTAAAINDNDELLIIAVAQPEGDTSRPARTSNPSAVTNYTQIFRQPVEATETLRHSDSNTQPNDWAYQSKKNAIEHAKDIEYALWFGRPSENTSGSQPLRTTGGVWHWLTQNLTDAGGAFTEAEFRAALRPIYRYSSQKRIGFASPLVVDIINGFANGKLQMNQSDNTYGLAIFNYVTPHGSLRLVSHPLFEGTKYGSAMAVLDMDKVRYRYLANENGSRDTKLLRDRQAPDADTKKDEWLSEVGLEMGSAKAHGAVTNATS